MKPSICTFACYITVVCAAAGKVFQFALYGDISFLVYLLLAVGNLSVFPSIVSVGSQSLYPVILSAYSATVSVAKLKKGVDSTNTLGVIEKIHLFIPFLYPTWAQ